MGSGEGNRGEINTPGGQVAQDWGRKASVK